MIYFLFRLVSFILALLENQGILARVIAGVIPFAIPNTTYKAHVNQAHICSKRGGLAL
jgi:hypothetical protein